MPFKNPVPEPYFSAYLELFRHVFLSIRFETASPESMSREELLALVKDIHFLSHSLHNIPSHLMNMGTLTPQTMEAIFLSRYDAREHERTPIVRLVKLLRKCIALTSE